jgi:hypothetical protein
MADKVYRPQPKPGPVGKAVAGKSSSEQARIRAQSLAQVKSGSYTFVRDGITITASGWKYISPEEGGGESGLFQVVIAASDDNGPLPVDNPYLFVNPPYTVRDGTWHKEKVTERDEDDNPVLVDSDVPNVREDLIAAAEEMVFDTVIEVAKRAGWQR